MTHGGASPAVGGRIGPNAIIRLAEVLRPRLGEAELKALFTRAGLANYLTTPPQSMVDETEVARLHRSLRDSLGIVVAGDMARQAGLRTADYLLAHRIPHPVQALLKVLPARWAAHVLLMAIARNAWTFAGSGSFEFKVGRPTVLTLRDNPLCREVTLAEPGCAYYGATFERLFRTLVHGEARVTETDCEACGAAQCRFLVSW